MTSTRVAVAGDWHGDTRYAVAAIRYAAERGAQIILHTGDFGYWPSAYLFDVAGSATSIRDPARWAFGDAVSAALAEHDLTLWFVDGNHEAHDTLLAQPIDPATGRRPLRERVDHLPRGHRWTWAGSTWLALGGAASVDRQWRSEGHSWWREEYVTARQVTDAVAGGSVDIMLCHDGPWSTPHLRARYTQGWPDHDVARSNLNRKRIERAMVGTAAATIFHGHYHDRYSQTFDLAGAPRNVHGLGSNDGPAHANIVIVDTHGRLIDAPPASPA